MCAASRTAPHGTAGQEYIIEPAYEEFIEAVYLFMRRFVHDRNNRRMSLMRAMTLEALGQHLVMRERPVPRPGPGEILLEVAACGVCRTDLHVVNGELPDPKLPIIPGHEVVGRVAALGDNVSGFALGERVGVPWLGHTCGICPYCRSARENLCDAPLFTGYTRDGGYATHTIADAQYCFALPGALTTLTRRRCCAPG